MSYCHTPLIFDIILRSQQRRGNNRLRLWRCLFLFFQEGTLRCQDHFVSLHLLTIITGQGHNNNVTDFSHWYKYCLLLWNSNVNKGNRQWPLDHVNQVFGDVFFISNSFRKSFQPLVTGNHRPKAQQSCYNSQCCYNGQIWWCVPNIFFVITPKRQNNLKIFEEKIFAVFFLRSFILMFHQRKET